MSTKQQNVPKLRFPEFSGAWEEHDLSNCIQSLDAGISVNSGDRPAENNEFGVLKTSCVTLGEFNPDENKHVFEDVEICRLKEPVVADTIIISRMNTPSLVGANAIVRQDFPNLFLPDRLWAAKVKSTASPVWVALLLSRFQMRDALSARATGTSGWFSPKT